MTICRKSNSLNSRCSPIVVRLNDTPLHESLVSSPSTIPIISFQNLAFMHGGLFQSCACCQYNYIGRVSSRNQCLEWKWVRYFMHVYIIMITLLTTSSYYIATVTVTVTVAIIHCMCIYIYVYIYIYIYISSFLFFSPYLSIYTFSLFSFFFNFSFSTNESHAGGSACRIYYCGCSVSDRLSTHEWVFFNLSPSRFIPMHDMNGRPKETSTSPLSCWPSLNSNCVLLAKWCLFLASRYFTIYRHPVYTYYRFQCKFLCSIISTLYLLRVAIPTVDFFTTSAHFFMRDKVPDFRYNNSCSCVDT